MTFGSSRWESSLHRRVERRAVGVVLGRCVGWFRGRADMLCDERIQLDAAARRRTLLRRREGLVDGPQILNSRQDCNRSKVPSAPDLDDTAETVDERGGHREQ